MRVALTDYGAVWECFRGGSPGVPTKDLHRNHLRRREAYRPNDLLERPPLPADKTREQKKEVTEMLSSITTATAAQSVAPAAPASSSKKAPEQKQQSSGGADTVHLSSTAQAHLSAIQAASQEATETPAQTAKEALGGDRQAQRLLAREARANAQSGEYGPRTVRGR